MTKEDQDIRELDQAATAASDFLKALASPNRLKILCNLLDGEKSVGQIAALVGIRETAASQHLTLLRKDGLVHSRRAGQTIFYAMDSPLAESILHLLYREFCPQGAAVEASVAGSAETATPPTDRSASGAP
jgi:DNA-binding transcriptional ArsR family regulator